MHDHEDSWAENENATAPHTEDEDDENNTKNLFGKAKGIGEEKKSTLSKDEEEVTTDIKNVSTSRNSTDDDFGTHIIESLLSPYHWSDWDEDNEDDPEKDGMTNHKGVSPDEGIDMHGDNEDSHGEGFEEGFGMGKNSSDHFPKMTENGDSDIFGELFGGESDSHSDSDYSTDSGTKTDSHTGDELTHHDDGVADGWEGDVSEHDAYDYHK